jgi:phenylalanine-4-hydroxylase
MLHVFDRPPPGAASDWTMPENWEAHSPAQHADWDKLFARQSTALAGLACEAFMNGLGLLQLSGTGIPRLADINDHLGRLTGWQMVAVPGVIPNDAFFAHLAARRFPVANFLRPSHALDYSEEPDMFHDIFGHVPMLTDPVFGDFIEAYGRAGLRAEKLGGADFLGRLYLHTVEFGLVSEAGGLRAYGAGLLSSVAETVHAVGADGVRRLRFDLARIMRTEYLFDRFQPTYFVIDSFAQLLRETEDTDFASLYRQLADQMPLAAGEATAGDRAFVAS